MLAEVEVGDVEAAVTRARAAFPAWRGVPPAERSRLLLAIAGILEDRSEELATLETRNVGKPIRSSRAEVASAVHTFRYFAGAPERLTGETIPVAGGVDMTFHEPLGVVGLIVPWNFPLVITCWKVAPALAAGNTVVLKPSELTPLTALELERLAREAGLPEGVLNVVNGPGPVVGEQLVAHPDVAKIAFTGSTAVGRRIGEVCAASVKRLTLELGGKSASIVFADADLEAAADAAPLAVFDNAGQDCCARSRILVEKNVVDRFLDLLGGAVTRLNVGNPLDERTDMGPLISAKQRERVASYVSDKAPVVIRGEAPSGPGFWYPPTVLYPVQNTDRVAREEVLGPSPRLSLSRTRTTLFDLRTSRSTGYPGRSGPATALVPCVWPEPWRAGHSASIPIPQFALRLPLVGSSSQGWDGNSARMPSSTTQRSRTSFSQQLSHRLGAAPWPRAPLVPN